MVYIKKWKITPHKSYIQYGLNEMVRCLFLLHEISGSDFVKKIKIESVLPINRLICPEHELIRIPWTNECKVTHERTYLHFIRTSFVLIPHLSPTIGPKVVGKLLQNLYPKEIFLRQCKFFWVNCKANIAFFKNWKCHCCSFCAPQKLAKTISQNQF